jgi:ClpP class serine protease
MKLSHIIQALIFSSWSGREAWELAYAVARPHIFGGVVIPELKNAGDDDEEATDFMGNPLPKMEIQDGVAIIPINGTLIHKATLMEKQCGACSYGDIKANVTEALDKGVSKIVLNVDCPGGMSQGASETGKFIQRSAEYCRIEAVTDGMMCSAAYEVCAAAHRISCTPTAQVGSIGTFMAWLDETVRYQMSGLKMDVIASGPLKGAGVSGTSLTPEQRANFQAQVDKFANMFKAHVHANRLADDSVMQGQSFIGSDAKDAGLVDDIVDDVEECFEL